MEDEFSIEGQMADWKYRTVKLRVLSWLYDHVHMIWHIGRNFESWALRHHLDRKLTTKDYWDNAKAGIWYPNGNPQHLTWKDVRKDLGYS